MQTNITKTPAGMLTEIHLNLPVGRHITFDPKWNNGTGYFDHCVTADLTTDDGKDVEVGKRYASMDDQGRRLLIVPTPIGNVVLFERHTNSDRGIVVFNAPASIEALWDGSLSRDQVESIVGYDDSATHIGKIVRNMIDAYNGKKVVAV